MAQYTLLVFTRPVGGRAEEFNRWYDDVHLADVLRVPGFVAAQRWVAQAAYGGGNGPAHGDEHGATSEPTYVAAFDIESDDIDATMATFDRERADMPSTPALDPQSVSFALYRTVLGVTRRA